MDPFEVLYGRRCRSLVGWLEVSEIALIVPEQVCEDIEKVHRIRERLEKTLSRLKSNDNVRRRNFKFDVGDWVYLKIVPMKGVIQFGKRGNFITCS